MGSRGFFSLVFTGLLCLALASPVAAHPVGPGVPYSVRVEDEWGQALRAFHKGGKTYVLGSWGQRYTIRVRNQTGRRVEAVVTVDGRDVVSGGVGDYVGQRGYVIDPHDSVVIEGFRKSLDHVAAFRFTDPADSYSSRMGTPQHVGVIGVAFFPERVQRRRAPIARPSRRVRPTNPRHLKGRKRSHAAPRAESAAPADLGAAAGARGRSAPSSSRGQASEPMELESDATAQNLGTQYGEDRHSEVREVRFRRSNRRRPSQVVTLHYDNAEGLQARGISIYRRPPVVRRSPEAFPRNRFAPPPPGY